MKLIIVGASDHGRAVTEIAFLCGICEDCKVGTGAMVINGIQTRGACKGVRAKMVDNAKKSGECWLKCNQYTFMFSNRRAA